MPITPGRPPGSSPLAACAAELPETDRAPVLERLKLAREFLGTQDPLDFFLSWKTPVERYRPRYAEPDFDSEIEAGTMLGDEGEQECDSSEGSL
jgi:hypothetical protein